MSTEVDERAEVVQLTAFRVGDEEYVVDIRRVREIIRPPSITPIRRGPKFVEGVINLRDEVIPVVDLRRRFGLPQEATPQQKVLIVWVDGRTVGLVVDAVTEVVRLPRSAMRAAPGLLEGDKAPYFLGVCSLGKRVLVMLNVKNVVVSDEEIDPTLATELLGGGT